MAYRFTASASGGNTITQRIIAFGGTSRKLGALKKLELGSGRLGQTGAELLAYTLRIGTRSFAFWKNSSGTQPNAATSVMTRIFSRGKSTLFEFPMSRTGSGKQSQI